ncbi:hypothetical protein SK128_015092, partial [Halocaridina rubra]
FQKSTAAELVVPNSVNILSGPLLGTINMETITVHHHLVHMNHAAHIKNTNSNTQLHARKPAANTIICLL